MKKGITVRSVLNLKKRKQEADINKNDDLVVILEDDAVVDDQDLARSINQMPCHLESFISGHSKRLMKTVIREKDGFYSNNNYYRDTDH